MSERTRTRTFGGDLVPANVSGWRRWEPPYVPYEEPQDFTATRNVLSPLVQEQVTDWVTPGFRKKQAAGAIINNPLYLFRSVTTPPQPTSFYKSYTYYDDDGELRGSASSGNWDFNEAPLGSYIEPLTEDTSIPSTIDSLRDQAVTQAHANASSSKAEGLVVAAESEKTVASAISIMGRALKVVRAAKRLDIKYLKRELSPKELANRYMELRYAIRPVVYDVNNFTAALEQSRSLQFSRFTSRGFRSLNRTFSDTIPLVGYPDGTGTVNRQATYRVNIRAGVLSEVQQSHLSTWGGDQLLETAWELVPFSFIADWFANFGDIIATITPNIGVRELASWVTTETTVTQRNWCDSVQMTKDPAVYTASCVLNHSGERKYESFHKSRVPNPELSYYPRSNMRLDGLKLLDLAIILRRFR